MNGAFHQPHSTPSEHILRSLKQAADRIQELESREKEAIAIVGIGCRFPGGIYDGQSFWELLSRGGDALSDVPADRWSAEQFEGGTPGEAGKIASRRGGYIRDVELFDPRFFGISAREAVDMDPQQRMVLECAWEALENAGSDWTKLKHSRTGVFIGATTNDYGRLSLSKMRLEDIEAHFATGNALNSIAGRVSYTLGLEGPCLTIDTACSSSLAAVHLACQSLKSGECDVALAGGVNLILMPEASIATSRARMLSPDGRCKTFDRSADGYVRSEGCGVVVLMRSRDAIGERRRAYASIRGSAINQNGESSGLTVPSRRAQERLIQDTIAIAGLSATDIDYVEAHGTGTSLGDPVELGALNAVYGCVARSNPLLVGSVKSNIGHAESAAGVAGLIKAALAVWHNEIPPTIHCPDPTPHFNWKESGLEVCADGSKWPNAPVRRAAVSSFGASGSNAHLILENHEVATSSPSRRSEPFLLALSAKSPAALATTARGAATFLKHSSSLFSDLCRTVNLRRQWPVRILVRAHSCVEASEVLERYLAGAEDARLFVPERSEAVGSRKRMRFVLSGSDPKAPAILELYKAYPAFRRSFDELDTELGTPSRWLSEIRAGGSPTFRADPAALFVVAVAEAALWRSCGVVPEEFAASGNGVLAAAYLSGAADLIWVAESLKGAWREAGRPRLLITPFGDVSSCPPFLTKTLFAKNDGFPSPRHNPDADPALIFIGQGLWQMGLVEAYLAGRDIIWSQVYQHYEGGPRDFPTSVFERQRFWPGERGDVPIKTREPSIVDRHTRVESLGLTVIEAEVEGRQRRIFHDHLVFGHVVVAGACHIAMMVEACVSRWPNRELTITDLQFERPLIVGKQSQPTIQVLLEASGDKGSISSSSFETVPVEKEVVVHARATVVAEKMRPRVSADQILEACKSNCSQLVPTAEFYRHLQRRTNIEHRSLFRWIDKLEVGPGLAVARMVAPSHAADGSAFDAGLIDSCFQLIAAAAGDDRDGTYVPFGIGSLSILSQSITGDLTAVAEIGGSTEPGRNTVTGRVRLFDVEGALVASIDRLQFQRTRPELLLRNLTDPVELPLYTLAWSKHDGVVVTQRRLNTIVLTSDQGRARELCAELAQDFSSGITFLEINRNLADAKLTFAENERLQLRSFLTAAANSSETIRILFIPVNRPDGEVLTYAESALLDIVQDVVRARCSVEFVIVTMNAVATPPVGSTTVNAQESGLWGFASVLTREHPELGVRLLDVDYNAPAIELAAGLARSAAGDRLVLRKDAVYSASLSIMNNDEAELVVRTDRSYLVSGAFGGLGKLIAADLVSRGARHLILLGRNPESTGGFALVDQLRQQGVNVRYGAVDVSDRSAVRRCLDAAAETLPALGGVVHAAAVLDDVAIREASWERMYPVMASKTTGAWNLHLETLDTQLDFFVLFSSASALLGTPGQAAYAAANAALEGIASTRRALGHRASAIAWGPWARVGMTTHLSEQQNALLAKAGIGLIEPDEGLKAFGRAARQANSIALKLASTVTINNLTQGLWRGASSFAHNSAVGCAEPFPGNSQEIGDLLRRIVGSSLRMSVEEISMSESLTNLGVDSLIAMEIASSVAEELGVDLPLELLVSGTTPEKIVSEITTLLSTTRKQPLGLGSPLDSVGVDDLSDRIAALSDKEVEELLLQIQNDDEEP